MSCKICKEELSKGEAFTHYWLFHRHIMIEKIRKGKNKKKGILDYKARRLEDFL